MVPLATSLSQYLRLEQEYLPGTFGEGLKDWSEEVDTDDVALLDLHQRTITPGHHAVVAVCHGDQPVVQRLASNRASVSALLEEAQEMARIGCNRSSVGCRQ